MFQRFRLLSFCWMALLFLLSGCGTLEIGFENQSEGDAVSAVGTPLPKRQPQRDIEGRPASQGLHVTFIKNGNVWLWTEERGARPLTHDGAGGVTDVRLSNDGQQIAFLRQGALWVVDSAGQGERLLVSPSDLNKSAPAGSQLRFHTFDWVPGQPLVAYNTRQQEGVTRSDDLHLVDVESLEPRTWLPAGDGGNFYFSPDGNQVAIVTPGMIRVLNRDNRQLQAQLTYTPIQIAAYMHQLTSSSWSPSESNFPPGSAFNQLRHYIQPVWAEDSRSLWVFIPPADPLALPVQATTVWQIPLDGSLPRMKASLIAEPMSVTAISPDLSQVAYVAAIQPDSAAVRPQVEIMTLDSGEIINRFDEAYSLYGWSPDSQQIALLTDPDIPGITLATMAGRPSLSPSQSRRPISDLRWVESSRFLYLAPLDPGWALCLGQPGDDRQLLVADLDSPIYDFSLP